MAHSGDWDSLDGADTYYSYSWDFFRLYGRTLTTFAPAPGQSKLVPDLAESLGVPSDNSKTWTYKIRTGVKFEDGTPVTFELYVEVRPEIALARLGGFKLTRHVPPVSEEMLGDQIEQLRRQRAPWTPYTGQPQAGDYVVVSLTVLEDGEPQEPKRYELVLGEGRALPDVEAKILTLAPGETGETEIQLPDDFPDAAKRGQRRAGGRRALPDEVGRYLAGEDAGDDAVPQVAQARPAG